MLKDCCLLHNKFIHSFIHSITCPGKAATIIGMTSTKGTIYKESTRPADCYQSTQSDSDFDFRSITNLDSAHGDFRRLPHHHRCHRHLPRVFWTCARLNFLTFERYSCTRRTCSAAWRPRSYAPAKHECGDSLFDWMSASTNRNDAASTRSASPRKVKRPRTWVALKKKKSKDKKKSFVLNVCVSVRVFHRVHFSARVS